MDMHQEPKIGVWLIAFTSINLKISWVLGNKLVVSSYATSDFIKALLTHESYLASSRVFENAIETTFANFEIKEEGSDAVDKVATKVRLYEI